MAQVFVSYAHKDHKFVEGLKGKLLDANIQPMVDTDFLRPGEDWRQEIDTAIRDSFALIAVMTPNAFESKYVTYEWAFALGIGIKVIPLLLEKTQLHPRLDVLQYIPFDDPSELETAWQKLLNRLSELRTNYTPIRSKSSMDSAVEHLVYQLSDTNKDKRSKAAKALGDIKDKTAVPALINVLSNDTSWGVRRDAAGALGSIGDVDAVTWLILALHNDQSYRVKQGVAWALGEIGHNLSEGEYTYSESIISALRQTAYNDRERLVREVCVDALGKISREGNYKAEATETLIDLFMRDFIDKSIIIEQLRKNDSDDASLIVSQWDRKQNINNITKMLDAYRSRKNQQ